MPSRSRVRVRKSFSDTNPEQVSELSRHLLKAQEEERKRISRELHDETGQGLMVLRLQLGMVSASADHEVNGKIEKAMQTLDRTIGDLRRVIARLSPRVLDELGLLAAIRKEARELSRTAGIKARLDLPDTLDGIDHELEIAIYRTVQEALHNVAKHAQAKNFLVALDVERGSVRVRVEDDGVGFRRSPGSAPGREFGIAGMRERIAALCGSVRIQSRRGRGTRVKVVVPARGATAARKQLLDMQVAQQPASRPSKRGARKYDNRTAAIFSRSGKGDSPSHEWQSSA